MNRERLEAATALYQTLEESGIGDTLHPHAGNRLVAWGEQLKDLQGGVRAHDLKSFLVLHPPFSSAGLTTPGLVVNSPSASPTLLLRHHRTQGLLYLPAAPNARLCPCGRSIQVILERASEQAQERLRVRQHTELTKVFPWAA